jgi:BASS family bile acid:Na+ symporter
MENFRSILISLKAYMNVLALILAMGTGVLIPQASELSFLVRYLLMGMLFFSFLDLEFKLETFQKGGIFVLAANLAMAFGAYLVISVVRSDLAIVAFITAISPTAIAAPVIISFLQGKVEFVVASVFVTNIGVALIIPLVLPYMVQGGAGVTVWEVLQPVLITMFVPLILARLVAYLPDKARGLIRSGKRLTFPAWIANLFIISANASNFIRNDRSDSLLMLVQIAALSLLICVANFSLGALLGGRTYRREFSQALGQKNLSFSIWIALTFIHPLAAMGPTFYVLYHNLYNTWQIYRFKRHNGKS